MPLPSSCICGNAAGKYMYMRQCQWQVHVYAAMPLGSNPIFVPRCCNAIIAILILGALLLVDSSKNLRQCREKEHMRQCRAAMPHSSGTLRYYRANTCFCLLFSQALRTLYMSPPCDRQAFTSLTSSARQSSFVTVNLYFQLSTCCITSTSRSKSLSSSKHATTTPTD